MRAHVSVLRQVLAFAGHLWRGAAHRRQQCQEAMTPGQVEVGYLICWWIWYNLAYNVQAR